MGWPWRVCAALTGLAWAALFTFGAWGLWRDRPHSRQDELERLEILRKYGGSHDDRWRATRSATWLGMGMNVSIAALGAALYGGLALGRIHPP